MSDNHNKSNTKQSDQKIPSYADLYSPPKPSAAAKSSFLSGKSDFSLGSAPVISDPIPASARSMNRAGSAWSDDVAKTAPRQLPKQSAAQIKQPSSFAIDTSRSEDLEDQNIFFLLGVTDGTDEEKEKFLDELQQVIWEDFLDNDLNLLTTEEEYQKVETILSNPAKTDLEKQEEVLSFLEGLIPDLEEIMLEKALELKEELVKERIAGMKEYYAGQQASSDRVLEAESLLRQNKWYSMAKILNSLN
ncbi:MAG: hypothetical protein PVJ09_00455 [Candidatus Woesebacteria bacterium]|jgi:hypothetical protein